MAERGKEQFKIQNSRFKIRIIFPWHGIQGLLEEMVSLIGGVLAPLRKVNSRIRELVDEGHDDFEHVWGDLAAVFSRLDAASQFLRRVLDGEEPEEVFWVQVRDRAGSKQVDLHLTPLDVAPILEQTLFAQVPAVVMTSATLTVSGSFDFFDRQLGINRLSDREIRHWTYPTPFDLSKQMRMAVLDSLPDPGSYGFTDALSGSVRDLVLAAGGGTLVLFTSYRTLSSVHGNCREKLDEAGIHIMRQGEAQRSVLLERFRADPDSVLFATDSFWEGVDVVGTSLRLVILARLPFPVPTDPINEARSQVLVQQGREPFNEDSLPRAVIRFRQGVGRLIRHRYDRGYVVICDGRVVRRSYGRIFLSSVGDVDVSRASLDELKRDVEQFLWPKK
jgi:ATP-dependent DNA helicase DinG